MGRLGLALSCFFRVLAGRPVPEEALPEAAPPPPALPPPEPEDRSDDLRREGAVQILALLQKEGRLLDFLQEEIDEYTDAQVGAAVRNIHRDCRKVLGEQVGIRPLMSEPEESTVTVQPGFDTSTVRLIGNVTGEPPFSGVLRHHGWRAGEVKVSPLPEGHDPTVLAPAEVELP